MEHLDEKVLKVGPWGKLRLFSLNTESCTKSMVQT